MFRTHAQAFAKRPLAAPAPAPAAVREPVSEPMFEPMPEPMLETTSETMSEPLPACAQAAVMRALTPGVVASQPSARDLAVCSYRWPVAVARRAPPQTYEPAREPRRKRANARERRLPIRRRVRHGARTRCWNGAWHGALDVPRAPRAAPRECQSERALLAAPCVRRRVSAGPASPQTPCVCPWRSVAVNGSILRQTRGTVCAASNQSPTLARVSYRARARDANGRRENTRASSILLTPPRVGIERPPQSTAHLRAPPSPASSCVACAARTFPRCRNRSGTADSRVHCTSPTARAEPTIWRAASFHAHRWTPLFVAPLRDLLRDICARRLCETSV